MRAFNRKTRAKWSHNPSGDLFNELVKAIKNVFRRNG